MQGRVLLVDDEAQVLASLQLALRREPFQLVTASSADEALAVLAREPIDVVVSDEHMPGMSGVQFLSLVREQFPASVRVMLTGQARLDAAIQAIDRAAIYRFVTKPYDATDLAACLRDALSVRTRQRTGEFHPAALMRGAEAHAPPDRAELNTRLDRAIDALWIAVQPVVSPKRQLVYAHETLARTHEPSVANAGVLFELAEQLDRVVELDLAILSRVDEVIAAAPADSRFFVNLHPQTFEVVAQTSPSAMPLVRHAKRVIYELTERSRLDAVTALAERLGALRAQGFSIAVDDLGAGYAGLSSLAMVTPEVVKLDMTLVRGIEGSPTKITLVRAMSALCRELDITLVVEGIETRPEATTLADLGCDLMQGYYFARPARPFPAVRWPER